MNALQKLAVGATAAAVPLKLIGGGARRAITKVPTKLKPPRPTPRLPKAPSAEGYIPVPKLPSSATKNLTLAGSEQAVAAYKKVPRDLRAAVEQSGLVQAGVPPATALALAQISVQQASRRGIASGVPKGLRQSLHKHMTPRTAPASSGARRRLPTAVSEAPTLVEKVGAAQWGAFADELKMIVEAA